MKENNTYEDNLEGGSLPDFRDVNPFLVPSDYFEEAAAHLKRLCQLPQMTDDELPSDNSLSPTYFEDLTAQIKLRISLDEILSDNEEAGFDVPADYFDESQEEIFSAVKLNTLLAKSPEDGFTVENNYFDSLSTRITQRIATVSENEEKTAKPERVISIQRWMKYSAAACLLFVLSIGAYFGLNSEQAVTPVAQQAMAEPSLDAISDDELIGYLALNNDHDHLDYFVEYIYDNDENAEEKVCSKLDEQDLEAYINQML
ncbi:hypothetical protein M8998_14320 [Sphingobacterium sp. lm-10]|uniref:hypothetical protein n=1 Tax=Sphingobacterium sp. lm-10 TaxID=2944904 RepID=UPI002021D04A|nr:hypothetical protein [Sphingobacterium sp. lm-10]MCL7989120.1 hypothetical protein [Sphingobacterium sp. lm-10]